MWFSGSPVRSPSPLDGHNDYASEPEPEPQPQLEVKTEPLDLSELEPEAAGQPESNAEPVEQRRRLGHPRKHFLTPPAKAAAKYWPLPAPKRVFFNSLKPEPTISTSSAATGSQSPPKDTKVSLAPRLKLSCLRCSETFPTLISLQNHMLFSCKTYTLLSCDMCPYTTNRETAMDRHMEKMHPFETMPSTFKHRRTKSAGACIGDENVGGVTTVKKETFWQHSLQ